MPDECTFINCGHPKRRNYMNHCNDKKCGNYVNKCPKHRIDLEKGYSPYHRNRKPREQ